MRADLRVPDDHLSSEGNSVPPSSPTVLVLPSSFPGLCGAQCAIQFWGATLPQLPQTTPEHPLHATKDPQTISAILGGYAPPAPQNNLRTPPTRPKGPPNHFWRPPSAPKHPWRPQTEPLLAPKPAAQKKKKKSEAQFRSCLTQTGSKLASDFFVGDVFICWFFCAWLVLLLLLFCVFCRRQFGENINCLLICFCVLFRCVWRKH